MNRSRLLLLVLAITVIFYPIETQILFRHGIEFDYVRYFLAILLEGLFITFAIKPTLKSDYEGKRFLFLALLFWSIVILFNTIPSFSLEDRKLKQFITGGFLYALFPFFLCIDLSTYIKPVISFLKLIIVLSIGVLAIYLSDPSNYTIEYLSYAFATPAGLLLLLSFYNKKRSLLYIELLIVVLFLVLNMLSGRRAAVLFLSFFCIAPLFLMKGAKLEIRALYIALFVTGVIILVIHLADFDFIIDRFATGFSSRDAVLEEFVQDFTRSGDWFLGRGYLGEVDGGLLNNTIRDTREVVENGWLLYVLKGGIPYAVLFFLISAESIYLALFKSNNKLCKAAAFYLLYTFIDMIGFGALFVDIKTVAIFMSISICHNRQLLSLSDNDIRDELC